MSLLLDVSQVAHSPYKGITDCVTRMVRQEGLVSLWRSYRTTLVMNVPFTAAYFSVYEGSKNWLMHVSLAGVLSFGFLWQTGFHAVARLDASWV
jgi:hypothetical protein